MVVDNAGEECLLDTLHKLEVKRNDDQKVLTEAQIALDEAKIALKFDGTPSNPKWFMNTRVIIRDRTNDIHSTNRRIKAIKSILYRSNLKNSYFREAAKKVLSKEQFDKIVDFVNKVLQDQF